MAYITQNTSKEIQFASNMLVVLWQDIIFSQCDRFWIDIKQKNHDFDSILWSSHVYAGLQTISLRQYIAMCKSNTKKENALYGDVNPCWPN